MKKKLLWILILVMCISAITVFSLTGCKEPEVVVETVTETVTETVVETVEVEAEGEEKVIGLSLAGRYSLAFIAGEDYMRRTADEKGFFVVTTVAENDVVKQAQDIDDLIARGVDCVIALPIDSKAIVSSIEAAHAAGLPIITYNRMEDPDAAEKSDAFVGQDTVAQAYDAAVELSKILEADGLAAEDVKILHIQGDLRDENALNRIEGFETAAAEFGWEIVAEVPTEWNPDIALNGTTNALQANKDINVMFVASDYLWPSVKTAMQSQDVLYPRGDDKHIYVASQDVFPVGYQDIIAQLIDTNAVFDVGQMSVQAIEIAEKLMNGEELSDRIFALQGRVATFDNVADMENLWGKEYQ